LPERVSLPFLTRHTIVLLATPNAIRSLIDALLRPQRIELNLIAEVGAVQTVLSLVALGIGCTILPIRASTRIRKSCTSTRTPATTRNTSIRARWEPKKKVVDRIAMKGETQLRQVEYWLTRYAR
jgi:DNA-binding transcriptional LysR family regulator